MSAIAEFSAPSVVRQMLIHATSAEENRQLTAMLQPIRRQLPGTDRARLHEREVCRKQTALRIQLLEVLRISGAIAIGCLYQGSRQGIAFRPQCQFLLGDGSGYLPA